MAKNKKPLKTGRTVAAMSALNGHDLNNIELKYPVGKYRRAEMSDRIAYLNYMLLCEVLLQCVEQLKGTAWFNEPLRLKTTLFMRQLETAAGKDLSNIWGVDDKALFSLMDNMSALITRLSSTTPEIWSMINELMDAYEEDRPAFLKRNNIDFILTEQAQADEQARKDENMKKAIEEVRALQEADEEEYQRTGKTYLERIKCE